MTLKFIHILLLKKWVNMNKKTIAIEKWNKTCGLLPKANDKDTMLKLFEANIAEELKPEIAYLIGLHYQTEDNIVEAKTWFELACELAWESKEIDKYKQACDDLKGTIHCQPHFGLGGRWFKCSLHGQNSMECIDDMDKYETWQCKVCGICANIRCRHFTDEGEL